MPNSKGNPISGGVKYMEGVKIGDFRAILDVHHHLSRKRCEIGQLLLWNVNRKSWVPDGLVSFSMTLSDPQPGFQGHCDIVTSRISQKWCILGTVTENTNKKHT